MKVILNNKMLSELIENDFIKKGTKINVYEGGEFVTQISYDGYDLCWKPGDFSTGMLYDEDVEFEVVDENEFIFVEELDSCAVYSGIINGLIYNQNKLIEKVSNLEKMINNN